MSAEEVSKKIHEQGDLVRKLKADGGSKDDIQSAVCAWKVGYRIGVLWHGCDGTGAPYVMYICMVFLPLVSKLL